MSEPRRSPTRRIIRPAVVATALAGGVTATALAQRRHLKTLATDAEFLALSEPLTDTVSEHAVLSIDSADGTVIHAERFGPAQGNATLVLAHGWTEAIPYWGPVIRRLASEDLTLVAYDLRGHGQSELAQDSDYGLERFGEDLEAVLAAAGGDPARTAVAGHSLGAMSIAAWAESHDVTGRIGAAAMINTGLSNLLGGALVLGEIGSRLAPEWVSRGLLGSGRPLLPVSTPLSLAIARHVAFGPDASAGMIAFYERMLMSTDAGVRGAVGITLSDLDVLQAAARITVPTIVIAGDSDRLTPAVHAERIARALPSLAGLTILDRTGHMSPLERPDEVASALRTLLAGMGDARATPAAEPAQTEVAG
jgi:pimeloyl-ACP methyl ester carboxylesterase